MDEQAAAHAQQQAAAAHAQQQANFQAQLNALHQQLQALNAAGQQGAGGAFRNLVKPEKFNGDPKSSDWVSFRLQFERAVEANGWPDRQARFALAACMTGTAAMVVQDLNPDSPEHLDLARLLAAYQKRFLPISASSKSQCDYETAQQEPREDVLTFHSRLRGLFIRAYPGEATNTSTNLIRRFCRGVRGEDLQIWLFRQKPETYDKALDIAQSDFAAKEMVRYNRAGHLRSSTEPMDINAMSPKCWNCEKLGHVAKECKAPKKKRFLTKTNPQKPTLRKTNSKFLARKGKWRKSVNALVDMLAEEEDEERYHQILALLEDNEEEEEAEEENEETPPEDEQLEGNTDSSSDFH